MIRTFNHGHVAMGNELSITNGVTRDVRAAILYREEQDRERRKAYRKKRTKRVFKELVCPEHLRCGV